MKDKTGFVSGDELLASLSATPQEIASAMDWLSSLDSWSAFVLHLIAP